MYQLNSTQTDGIEINYDWSVHKSLIMIIIIDRIINYNFVVDEIFLIEMWIYLLIGAISVVTTDQEGLVCNRQNFNNKPESHCSDIPSKEEWERIKNTTIQTIRCKHSNKSNSLSDIRMKNLQRLVYIYIGDCNVQSLPMNFFEDLTQLETVYLDNLPIEILKENTFKNSSNIIELILSGLGSLKRIHPRFLGDQNKLATLTLTKSNIDPTQLRPTLLTVYNTLAKFYWRRNVQNLIIGKDYFQPFNFESVILEYNGITNTDFLELLNTKELSLKGNPIGIKEKLNWKNYRKLSKSLKKLDLSETGLDLRPDMKFPKLEELALSSNGIHQIPSHVEKFLPNLQLLDIRNNKLTTLPSLDYMLRYKFGKVYLQGNIFNCNCEMIWIRSIEADRIKGLKCDNVNFEKHVKNQELTRSRILKSKMICTEPLLKLQLSDQFKSYDYTISVVSDTLQIYKFDLYPNHLISWQCIGEGNPAPRLKWIKNQQTLKIENPPLDRLNNKTVMKNLIIPDDIKTADNETYVCRAKSIAGISEIRLEVTKKYSKNPMPALGQIDLQNFATENSKPSFLNLFLLMIINAFIR